MESVHTSIVDAEVKLEHSFEEYAPNDCAHALRFGPEYYPDLAIHPYDSVSWERGPVEIADGTGAVVFFERDAEFPVCWGPMARSIVASKYFWGDRDRGFRETSLRELLSRVTVTIAAWAVADRLFATGDDARRWYYALLDMQIKQEFAFNSPVYFNVGIHYYVDGLSPENFRWDRCAGRVVSCEDAYSHPQISACFIQSVEDSMSSIMELARSEAMLFKRGSGTGTDLTPLRSSREKLSGGGKPSGPVSFMRVYDSVAAIVKSGGVTRRAAKMQTLKYHHPDIMEFIRAKAEEEKKARALIAAGYAGDLNGSAYASVDFQNCNMSVRITDEVMEMCVSGGSFCTRAVTTGAPVDLIDAPSFIDEIARCAHECGDPGIQFEDRFQEYHTVPNHGPINSSNPCGEYNFIDDSACNLASFNVLKFGGSEGLFDAARFRRACRVACTAMEVMVDEGSYPTAKITENSHRFRPLGGGYANVGAYLMTRGVPYDSADGRTIVAAFTALLTGTFYAQSARLAALLGPFDGFAANRDGMLSVMEAHRNAAIANVCDSTNNDLVSDDGLFKASSRIWDEVIGLGEVYGYRNAQATVIAPTGTIGFMMGCDTLGIEPEIALVRFKALAGGGMLRIVNGAVPEALRGIGYSDDEVRGITNHIIKYNTIEDVIVTLADGRTETIAPDLLDEDLPIFDCAFPPSPGRHEGMDYRPAVGRSLAPMGHVRMMAAVTPLVSGSVSKTVNMPSIASIEDIKDVYVKSWQMGVKAIAVYRDGSKGCQPVTTAAPGPAPVRTIDPGRFRMPDDRPAKIHKFDIDGHEGFIIPGYSSDGKIGEVFIEMSKQGSTIGGLLDVIGTLISLALQYRVPLAKVAGKLVDHSFPPAGITKHPTIRFCRSIADYIGRWLMLEESPLPPAESPDPVSVSVPVPFAGEIHGPPCPRCGSIMVRQGSCEQCFMCGNQIGACG